MKDIIITVAFACIMVTSVVSAEDASYCEDKIKKILQEYGWKYPDDLTTKYPSFSCIEAYFNGKFIEPGSVPSPRLKIGEPFKVRVDFLVGQDAIVTAQIKSTGYIRYEVVEGPSPWDEYTKDEEILPGITKSYEWTLKPDGSWTMGTAPVRIRYEILDKNLRMVEDGTFTVANPYILQARYTGPESPTVPPSITSPEQPGFGIIAAVIGLAALARLGKRK
jgi:sarcinarray family protein